MHQNTHKKRKKKRKRKGKKEEGERGRKEGRKEGRKAKEGGWEGGREGRRKNSPQGQMVRPTAGSETCLPQFSERPAETSEEPAAASQLEQLKD